MESGGEVKAEASPSAGNPSVTEKPQTKDPEPKEVITQTKPEQTVKDTLSNASSDIKNVPPANPPSPVVVLTPKPTPKTPAQSASPDVFIAIQIGASKNPKVDNPAFLKNQDVRAVACTDGYTRYVIGSFTNSESARKKMAQVKSAGHPDAFLTAFNKNQRIPIPEAEQILKRP
jgi:cell division protein FtsN